MILYPVILFLAWIGIIVRRMIDVFDANYSSWMDCFEYGTASSMGIFNAIVYGFISLNFSC